MNRLNLQKTILVYLGLAVVCFGLPSGALAVLPAPDGGYPGNNTAEGASALLNLTTGTNNTAVGSGALQKTTDGGYNSALGYGALQNNIHGAFNMAIGAQALYNNTANSNMAVGFRVLFSNTTGNNLTGIGAGALPNNTTGNSNTGIGAGVLAGNTTGSENTAVGRQSLLSNTTADDNSAFGYQALYSNTTGGGNVAIGYQALFSSTTAGFPPDDGTCNAVGYQALENNNGADNSAVGFQALQSNLTGNYNNAFGWKALQDCTGTSNTAIGDGAGRLATTGSGNVYIGAGMSGVAGESNACYIRSIFGQTSASGIPVLINSSNQLGTTTSSKRFKEDIKPMNKASEALFELKPVSFRYKKELDPAGIPQFGLVAEDVQKVDAALVVLDKEGKPYTVRYDQVNAMLLNEFLKEHRKVEAQETTIAELKSTVAQQQKGMDVLTAQLKEQATQIQKVSAQVELNRSATRTVAIGQ